MGWEPKRLISNTASADGGQSGSKDDNTMYAFGAAKFVLVPLMMLAHEAIEALRIVPRQITRTGA